MSQFMIKMIIIVLKFENNSDFLVFLTKVSPKVTCFWHFFLLKMTYFY